MNWSLSEFPVSSLVDGEAFPAYSVLDLGLFDADGDKLQTENGTDYIYLPFVDYECLSQNWTGLAAPEVAVLSDNQTR